MKLSTDDLVAVYARAGYGKQLHDLTLEQKEATARGIEAVLEAAHAIAADVGAMEYRGNTVSYVYDKKDAYGLAIDRTWEALKAAGHHFDGPLWEAVAHALATSEQTAEMISPTLNGDMLSDFPGPAAADPYPLILHPAIEHPAVTIVRELVALRDMKDRMQSLRISAVELEALVEEYARRKPGAWKAARALVGGG